MSLLDQFDKNNNENKIVCKKCNTSIPIESQILLCEKCFNENIQNSLNIIKDNLVKIDSELLKIKKTIEEMTKELNKPNLHTIVLNKLEIDLLNLSAIRDKLEIDRKLNIKAFILNQEQANKLRKDLNWAIFDIISLKEIFGDQYE